MYWAILPATSSWSGDNKRRRKFTDAQGRVCVCLRLYAFVCMTAGTCLWRLGAAEHVSPCPVQEGGAVAVVKGTEVLGNRMGAWMGEKEEELGLEVKKK